MSTITTRTSKGSALSWAEADANFTNLNADKLEVTTLQAATNKTTPDDADIVPIVDSVLKKVTWANIKATLKTYFDTLYAATFTIPTGIVKGNGSAFSAATAGTDYPGLASVNTFTAAQKAAVVANAASLSFDLSGAGNDYSCTPSAGGALTFTNIASNAGKSGHIILVNGSNYAITAGTNTKCPSGLFTTLSVTGTYIVGYWCNGTNVYITSAGAMA